MVRRPMPGQEKIFLVTIAPGEQSAELEAEYGDDRQHRVT